MNVTTHAPNEKVYTMGNRALKRRIASLRQRITEHEEKLLQNEKDTVQMTD